MADFEITNIVGMITYRQELDLSALAETFEQRDEISSVNYEPAENHWLQTWFAPSDTYVPFYRSGKCSIVGVRNLEDFYKMADRVNRVMRDLLDFKYEPKIEIKNIVATADLKTIPRLDVLAIGLGLEQTEYEPEQFPALIYRGSESVLLIFSSGKIVCTGLTEIDQVSAVVDDITAKIKKLAAS